MSTEKIKTLLYRSYAGKLIESYIQSFNKHVGNKMDFTLLSKRQEALEHIEEVFEQDLRLQNSQDPFEVYCKQNYKKIIAVYIALLLHKETNTPYTSLLKHNLALKGLIKDEEERQSILINLQ